MGRLRSHPAASRMSVRSHLYLCFCFSTDKAPGYVSYWEPTMLAVTSSLRNFVFSVLLWNLPETYLCLWSFCLDQYQFGTISSVTTSSLSAESVLCPLSTSLPHNKNLPELSSPSWKPLPSPLSQPPHWSLLYKNTIIFRLWKVNSSSFCDNQISRPHTAETIHCK